MLRLNFGNSLVTGVPAAQQLTARIPVSIELALLALLVTLSSVFRSASSPRFDRTEPSTRIGPVARDRRAVDAGLLDRHSADRGALAAVALRGAADVLRAVGKPAGESADDAVASTCAGLRSSAGVLRFTRSGLLEVIDAEYVRTARAKGFSGTRLVIGHALRNAFLPS